MGDPVTSRIDAEMATRAEFEIVYDGPIIAGGEIDVRDLSPALLGVADFLSLANRKANGDGAYSSLKVKAGPRAGSFGVELILDTGLWETAKGLFTGADWTTATELLSALGLGGRGFLWLKKRLQGEKPEVVRKLDDGKVEIRLDGKVEVTHRVVLELLNDPKAVAATSEMLRPLEREGIEEFEVRSGGRVMETVQKEELPLLLPEEPVDLEIDRPLLDNTTPALLEIVKPSFRNSLKWVVTDGTKQFSATMKDEAFQAGVNDRSIGFRRGDVLRVRMRVVVGRDAKGGLSQRHEIVEVLGILGDEPAAGTARPEETSLFDANRSERE